MHYIYRHSRFQTARSVGLSMLALAGWLGVFFYFGGSEPEHESTLRLFVCIVGAVEVLLFLLLIWLLRNPSTFEIRLTQNALSQTHPFHREWNFSIDPREIERVDNLLWGTTDRIPRRIIRMRDGRSFELSLNYRYSADALFDALHQINPEIRLPQRPHLFKRSKEDACSYLPFSKLTETERAAAERPDTKKEPPPRGPLL